ncbi:MAG: DUF5702 domain-containing protein [Lachnospiraceae bacterium]|nr:DUF5702 domain-containing protein [Lachnospiraceae bacterium]
MKGYLTALTAMLLAVLLPLWLLLIEGSRISGMKARAEMVMDTGMNSILAEYQREMLSYYDLFFFDTSYCSPLPSRAKTAEHLRSYLNKNLEPVEDLFSWTLLAPTGGNMSATEVTIDEVRYAMDGAGAVLRDQILQYELDLWGIAGLVGTPEQKASKEWEDSGIEGMLDNHYDQLWKKAQEDLEPYRYGRASEEEGGGEIPALENPADYLFSLGGAAVIGMVLSDGTSVSEEDVYVDHYYSAGRAKKGTVILGNMEHPGWNGTMFSRLFILEYLTHHFTSYQTDEKVPEHPSRLSCQLEYILAGKGSDKANLEETLGKLLAVRQAVNTAYLLTDSEKQGKLQVAASAIAVAASAITMSPVPTEPIKMSLTMAWGLLESIQDLKILCSGGKISLLKAQGKWRSDLDSIKNPGGSVHADPGDEHGLTYNQYVGILLLLQNETEQMGRVADLMEMDIRMTKGNEFFRIDACADRLVGRARIGREGTWFYIRREYGYEG